MEFQGSFYVQEAQRMTYCEIFTIGNADCLVMKKIGNRTITESQYQLLNLTNT